MLLFDYTFSFFFKYTTCVELNNLCDYFHAGNFAYIYVSWALLDSLPVSWSNCSTKNLSICSFTISRAHCVIFLCLRKVKNASHSAAHIHSKLSIFFHFEDLCSLCFSEVFFCFSSLSYFLLFAEELLLRLSGWMGLKWRQTFLLAQANIAQRQRNEILWKNLRRKKIKFCEFAFLLLWLLCRPRLVRSFSHVDT